MNGQDRQAAAAYGRTNDNMARAIAYFSPLLFWGVVAVIVGGIFVLG